MREMYGPGWVDVKATVSASSRIGSRSKEYYIYFPEATDNPLRFAVSVDDVHVTVFAGTSAHSKFRGPWADVATTIDEAKAWAVALWKLT